MNNENPTQRKLRRIFKQGSESFFKRNRDDNSSVHTTKQECIEGMPLERALPRKKKSCHSTEGRVKITYTIYSVRPLDYDNYWTKCLTDCLVGAKFLLGDAWWLLRGETISEKAHSKEEERIEIKIE